MTTVTAAGAEREHKAYAVTTDTRLALAPAFGEMGLPALSFSPLARFFSPEGTPKRHHH
jgi:tripartite-type tricarboxylate transporter receptor subunit TctC